MFKRFEKSETSTSTQVKASVQRGIRAQIAEANPNITEEQLDVLLPKKQPLVQFKVGPHMMLYCRRVEHEDVSPTDEPVFFQHRDGPILPTLRLVHKYPTLKLKEVTVDKGAIPFILGGANVMAPGLTKPGQSIMPPDGEEQDAQGFDKPGLSKGDGVVIMAEGKEHAVAVGVMTMSSAEMYVIRCRRDWGWRLCLRMPMRCDYSHACDCRLVLVWLLSYISREKNKGVAIELAHFLGDGLFMADEL